MALGSWWTVTLRYARIDTCSMLSAPGLDDGLATGTLITELPDDGDIPEEPLAVPAHAPPVSILPCDGPGGAKWKVRCARSRALRHV